MNRDAILIMIAGFSVAFIGTLTLLVLADWDCASHRTGLKACVGTIMARQEW